MIKAQYWGVLGKIPWSGFPCLAEILLLNIASNDTFCGTYVKDFEAHATGISLVYQQDLYITTRQEAESTNNRSQTIISRGLTLLTIESAKRFLELYLLASIAKVA